MTGKKYRQYGIEYQRLNPHEVKTRLQGFTKFIVVRNPFTRLVSAYRNKILQPARHKFRKRLKSYLQSIKSAEFHKEYPSFESFIKLVLSDSKFANNVHWNNYFERSHPCQVDYDYILKLETMQNDLKVLISNAYTDVDYRIYQNLHRNPTSKLEEQDRDLSVTQHHFVLKMYNEVDPVLLKQLADKYKYETLGFGYGFNISLSTWSVECLEVQKFTLDVVDRIYIEYISIINKARGPIG